MSEAIQLDDTKFDDTKSSLLVSAEQHTTIEETIRVRLGLESIDLRIGLDVARAQLQKGNVNEAFRTYATLVLCDPFDPELQVGVANCALHIQEYALALQAASAVVALVPSDPRGYCLSAKACIGLGQPQEAHEDLTSALELAGSSKDASLKQEIQLLLSELGDI